MVPQNALLVTIGGAGTKNGDPQRLSYNSSERSLCDDYLCLFPFAHLLKGEHGMKDQDLFSNDGSPPTEPQNAPSSTASPPMKPRLAPRHHVRLLLVALVVLIILAGGYGIFRAVSPPPRQAPSALQQAHCPFTPGQGLVEGKDVRCGFVVVPEDHSQPKGHT